MNGGDDTRRQINRAGHTNAAVKLLRVARRSPAHERRQPHDSIPRRNIRASPRSFPDSVRGDEIARIRLERRQKSDRCTSLPDDGPPTRAVVHALVPPTVIRVPRSSQPALSALVVQPHLPHLLFVLSTLSSLQFDVTVASTFKDAKSALAAARPMLLITDVRLQEYNGLHLVLRGRSSHHGLPAIVTSEIDDPVLRLEAEQLGATYASLPTTSEELVAAISRTILQAGGRDPVRPPFERRQGERRASEARTHGIDRRRRERRGDIADALRVLAAHP